MAPRKNNRTFAANVGVNVEFIVLEIFNADLFGAGKRKENEFLMRQIQS
jgi:hypothetical protein